MTDTCRVLQQRGHWAEDAMCGRCTFPIGPLNTWSNSAYLIAAGALLWRSIDAASLVMAASLCALGIGSGLYHGYKTLWANRLDWVGMYLVFGSLAVHGFPDSPLTPILMAVTGGLLALLFAYVIPRVSLEVQTGLLFWFAAVPIALKGHWPIVLSVLGVFVLAYGCWVGDRRGWTGRWGHAVWHVWSAIGIYLLYTGQG